MGSQGPRVDSDLVEAFASGRHGPLRPGTPWGSLCALFPWATVLSGPPAHGPVLPLPKP